MSECKHEWKMLIYSGAYAGAICTLCGETRSESETEALLNRQNKSADYWSNWVYPEGASPDDVQNELADFHDMIDRFECMLDHATGGRMSKATYTKDAMISAIDDHINELVDEETIALKEENAALSELLSPLVDVELERDKLEAENARLKLEKERLLNRANCYRICWANSLLGRSRYDET